MHGIIWLAKIRDLQAAFAVKYDDAYMQVYQREGWTWAINYTFCFIKLFNRVRKLIEMSVKNETFSEHT